MYSTRLLFLGCDRNLKNFVGAADVLPYVDSDLKKIAARVIEQAKEICTSRSVILVSVLVKKLINLFFFLIC